MRMFVILSVIAVFGLSSAAMADVVTESIEYMDGEQKLVGYLAYDDAAEGVRPGVLIVHQWKGLGDYEKQRARMLAEMGYVAFALDIYGEGNMPADYGAAGKIATHYKTHRDQLRHRANLGLTRLKAHPLVDAQRTAAIGYCFGGTAVIELARSGADVKGVVSFHGGLDSPSPEDGANITASVLVHHGADDPTVSAEAIAAFQQEMRTHKVDWRMVYHGGAVHSFTEKEADLRNNPTVVAYDKHADERSWASMRLFFDELFNADDE